MTSSYVYSNCICIIIAIIFLIISGVNYQKHFEYQNTDCIISNITYPTSLYDKQNLVTCECGHRCRSDSGTCIRIYGSSIDNPEIYVMFLETTKKNSNEECTFSEKKCNDGESINNRNIAIRKAKEKAKSYIKYNNTNNTIPCYQHNDGNIYLKNKSNYDQLIIAIVIFSILLVSLCIFYFCQNEE